MGSSDLSTLGKLPDVLCGTKSERLDGHRRLSPARGDEARSIAEKKIRHIVCAMVLVDNGACRIVPHAASAEQVHAAARLARRASPGLFSAGGLHDL